MAEASKTNQPKELTPIVTVGQAPASGQPGWAVPLTVAAALVTLLALVLLPGSLQDKLAYLDAGICPQRPGHSYFFQARQMPMEARMVGIFAGYLTTLTGLWLVGRGRALRWPRRSLTITLVLMVGWMAFDGFNSTFLDLGWPTLYQPQNWLRLLTGVVSGVGIAGLTLPAVNLLVWRRGYLTATFKNWWEIGLALGPALLYWQAVLSGWDWLYWLLSLLAVIGVVAMLSSFNLMIVVVLLRRENRASSFIDFLALATPVYLLSLGQMLVFAVLRLAFAGPSPAF